LHEGSVPEVTKPARAGIIPRDRGATTGERRSTQATRPMPTIRRLALAAVATAIAAAPARAQLPTYRDLPKFTVTSRDIRDGHVIPEKHVYRGFGCNGGNLSPQLAWKGAPANTKSFAVFVFDPDAPTASGWWHWVAYNIPAATTSLPQGAGDPAKALLPAGTVQGRTDFGSVGYGGPCPPATDRPHAYYFVVVALSVPKLDLPANATAAMVSFNVRANALAVGQVLARYSR
jgi:Raf kinase inhibitor-like YbhB/YbcL family protein